MLARRRPLCLAGLALAALGCSPSFTEPRVAMADHCDAGDAKACTELAIVSGTAPEERRRLLERACSNRYRIACEALTLGTTEPESAHDGQVFSCRAGYTRACVQLVGELETSDPAAAGAGYERICGMSRDVEDGVPSMVLDGIADACQRAGTLRGGDRGAKLSLLGDALQAEAVMVRDEEDSRDAIREESEARTRNRDFERLQAEADAARVARASPSRTNELVTQAFAVYTDALGSIGAARAGAARQNVTTSSATGADGAPAAGACAPCASTEGAMRRACERPTSAGCYSSSADMHECAARTPGCSKNPDWDRAEARRMRDAADEAK